MDLYIPYRYTPYEGTTHYGVYSSREKAQERLNNIHPAERYYGTYDIYVTQVDSEEVF